MAQLTTEAVLAVSSNRNEGNLVFCSSALMRVYGLTGKNFIRSQLRRWIVKVEGGPAHSLTIREIFRKFHGVEVGLYTAGPCQIKPQVFNRGTSIGRYSAIAETVRTFTGNHPRNTRSSHAVFYNGGLGWAKHAPVKSNPLFIGHGVWLGHNVIILPPAHQIGNGAIITAGSVVYTNVPPYAIVTGNPARVIGYRFSKEVIAELLKSRWWEDSPSQLEAKTTYFRQMGIATIAPVAEGIAV